MSGRRYRDFEELRHDLLRSRSGPLISPIEDIADEMYHQDLTDEFDSLWDSLDDDE